MKSWNNFVTLVGLSRLDLQGGFQVSKRQERVSRSHHCQDQKADCGGKSLFRNPRNSGNIGIHGVIKANAAQVEEDNFNFEAVSSTTVFPVFCQPLLVALNTVDENTKFVKFSLNKTIQVGSHPFKKTNTRRKKFHGIITQGQANAADWELLRDSAKVFWRGEKPYAFATVGKPFNLK